MSDNGKELKMQELEQVTGGKIMMDGKKQHGVVLLS